MVTIPDDERSVAPLIVILVLVLTVYVIVPYVMLVLLPDFKSLIFGSVLLIVFMAMAVRLMAGNAFFDWLKFIAFTITVRTFTLWLPSRGASDRIICAIHIAGCGSMFVWCTLSVLRLV